MESKLIALLFLLIGAAFGVSADERGKRVAVLPFTVRGNFDTLYAEVAQDSFITEMIKGKVYRVVERSQLDKAMKELRFQSGSDFDETSAMEVGKLAGAEIVAVGTITALKSRIIVNIRGINVKTGVAEFAEKDFIKSEDDLMRSVEKIAKNLPFSSPNAPDPSNYDNIDYAPTYDNRNYAAKLPSYNQNYANRPSNMDFSFSENYDDVPLSHSNKRFLIKFFQEKWGIDPRDTFNVYDVYKNYLAAGISMAAVGGTLALMGFIAAMVGLGISAEGHWWGFMYAFPSGLGTLFALGAPLAALSSWPFIIADKTKSIYRRFTGNKSLRLSAACGYGAKNERAIKIAFNYNF